MRVVFGVVVAWYSGHINHSGRWYLVLRGWSEGVILDPYLGYTPSRGVFWEGRILTLFDGILLF